jgi:hypothetical protein
MKTIKYLIMLTIAILYLSNLSNAEDIKPQLFGSFAPEVGSWSEYEVTEINKKRATTMRMSIVGQEGENYWYEVWNFDGENDNTIKMLVSGDPHDSKNVLRIIISSGNSKAMEMPRDFMVMGRKMAGHMFAQRSGMPGGLGQKVEIIELGKESIEVPAGLFTGNKKAIKDGKGKLLATYITVAKIKPFGIVYSKSKETIMRLTNYGKDAKSRITGEVSKMLLPPVMPPGFPKGLIPKTLTGEE